ncbi:MAG TPA: mercury(II) reductase [Myxococcales bacterium]|nr:mercury(II) reductase [Myxococcales bacterium]
MEGEMSERQEWSIEIEGMTCDGCAAGMDRAFGELAEVVASKTSYDEGRATVVTEASLGGDDLKAAVEGKGYRVRAITARASSTGEGASREGVDYDLAIIGSGSAGVAAAIKAAESGKRVAIIEAGTLGGTCVNVGCVPSKTLIRAAEARHRAATTPFAGIETSAAGVNFAALIRQKDELVAELRQAKYADVLAAYAGVTVIEGHARFAPSGELAVDGEPIRAASVLIATGSSPAIPPIEGLADTPYLTSKTAMELEALPEHLVVIGAGYVALELGQTFRRLGSRVTVLARSRLLSSEDPDVGDALFGFLSDEGVDIRLATSATRVEHTDGRFSLQLRGPEGETTLDADQLLVAAGRRPNTAGLGLEEVDIELGDSGEIRVDEHLRTTRAGVFAAGDVTGDPAFVYVAAYAGNLAGDGAINGVGRRYDTSIVPGVTFTDPAVASVGLHEHAARERGIDVVVSKLPMSYVPRAIAARDTRGFIKLVADRETKLLVGAQIVAPEAGELIQQAVIAMKFGIRTDQLAGLLYPYLTTAEGFKLACQTFGKDVAKLSCCAA